MSADLDAKTRLPGSALSSLVVTLPGLLKPKANSLMVTVFGDSVSPHGGRVWLGSLIRLVAPLGVNERLVRTAVNRLSGDDWLARQTIGRRAFYALSDTGRRRFEQATRRIYAGGPPAWDGRWLIVAASAIAPDDARRDDLRRELVWQGFGAIAPGVYTHPMADTVELRQILQDLELTDRVVVFETDTAPGSAAAAYDPRVAMRALVTRGWDLDRLGAAYRGFLDRFGPIWRDLKAEARIEPEHGFVIRTLLIHEYRRAILRDPMLPDELLPIDWPGTAARALCGDVYRRVWQSAEAYVLSNLESADGPLPEASPSFFRRFGGLTPGPAWDNAT
jgi:phenylacetic acid degradation operon negative regulatory protein